MRFQGSKNQTKIYQASTSELYGLVQEVPQNENTKFYELKKTQIQSIIKYCKS